VAAVVAVVIGLSLLALLGWSQAKSDAKTIKAGRIPEDPFVLWWPRPVNVVWKASRPPLALPGCKDLTFLTESGSRVLLYDAAGDQTVRLSSREVQLTFPDRC
jgi:hypothetical protein